MIKNIIMKKINKQDAKQIGTGLGINRNKMDIDEFTKGVNVELKYGRRDSETNVTNNDSLLTGKIAWAHLKEFPDYYTRLHKNGK